MLLLSAAYGALYESGAFRIQSPGDLQRHCLFRLLECATVVDLADFQQVAGPSPQPRDSVSVTDFGADPRGIRDSADAPHSSAAWNRTL